MKAFKSRAPLSEILAQVKPSVYFKLNSRTRDSSLSSATSSNSHQRSNSSLTVGQKKQGHRRTASTIQDLEVARPLSIQQEIAKNVCIIQENSEHKKEQLEKNKKNLKELLMQKLSCMENEENCKEVGNSKSEKGRLQRIIEHFFDAEECAGLKEMYVRKMKKYFVAISKQNTFAIYCKDTGNWKRLFGDSRIKITKNTAGSKMQFTSKGIVHCTKTQSYNVFILK